MKTHKQEIGVGAYQKAVIASMKGVVMSMLGQPTSPGKESLTERYRPPAGSAEWYAEKTGKPLAPLMPPALTATWARASGQEVRHVHQREQAV